MQLTWQTNKITYKQSLAIQELLLEQRTVGKYKHHARERGFWMVIGSVSNNQEEM